MERETGVEFRIVSFPWLGVSSLWCSQAARNARNVVIMVKRTVQGPRGQSSSTKGDRADSAPGIGSALQDLRGAPKVSTSPAQTLNIFRD